MKKYLLIFMVGLLTGCSEPENEDAKYWSYGFTSPPYYEMLLEHVTAVMPNKDEYNMWVGGGVVDFIEPMIVVLILTPCPVCGHRIN